MARACTLLGTRPRGLAHSKDTSDQACVKMAKQFSMATIPLPSMEGAPPNMPIFPTRTGDHLGKKLWELELSFRREGCPTVSEAALVAKTVTELGFFCGV